MKITISSIHVIKSYTEFNPVLEIVGNLCYSLVCSYYVFHFTDGPTSVLPIEIAAAIRETVKYCDAPLSVCFPLSIVLPYAVRHSSHGLSGICDAERICRNTFGKITERSRPHREIEHFPPHDAPHYRKKTLGKRRESFCGDRIIAFSPTRWAYSAFRARRSLPQ